MRTVALPNPWLSRAATLWFLVAATGLAIFTAYIGLSYGQAALGGAPGESRWVQGDGLGNGLLSMHLVAGLLLSALGMLQLVPALRRRAPSFHRWSGRVFMVGALIASLSGFYLVWRRGTVGDASMHAAMTLNGVLIVVFAWRAWQHARARQFDQHRRWALRLFLAANGVWFFRVGLMLWLLIWQQPVGFDPKTFTGPFVTALSFGQFLLPLGVLELYFRTRGRGRLMALGLVLCSLATAVGVFGAFMGLWWPRM